MRTGSSLSARFAQPHRGQPQRHVDPEHEGPGQVVGHPAAHHRPGDGGHAPHPRHVALVAAALPRRNHVGDRRLRHRHQPGAPQPLEAAEDDQLDQGLRQRAHHGGGDEQRQGGQQQGAAARMCRTACRRSASPRSRSAGRPTTIQDRWPNAFSSDAMAGTAGMTTVWSSAASRMHSMMPVMTRRMLLVGSRRRPLRRRWEAERRRRHWTAACGSLTPVSPPRQPSADAKLAPQRRIGCSSRRCSATARPRQAAIVTTR